MKTLALAALATAALGASLSTASAAPLVVGSYYQEYNLVQCTTSSCKLFFTAIPVGKTLILTDVNCTFALKSGYKPYGWDLLARKPTTSGIRRLTLTKAEETSTGFYTYYTLKAEGRHLVVAGDTPELSGLVYNSNGGTFNPGSYTPNCSISGILQ